MPCRSQGRDSGTFPGEFAASLERVGQHSRRALQWAALQHSHQPLERSEASQRALFAISDLPGSERDEPDMLRGIHAIVSTLMYAGNVFIALLDTEQDTIRFPYFVDVQDRHASGHGEDLPMAAIDRPGLPLPNGLCPVGNWRRLKLPPSRPMSSIRVSVVGARRWAGPMPAPRANMYVHCMPVAIVRFGGASVR